MFKDGGYLEQIAKGILQPSLKRSGHPSPLNSGQPICTQSQYIEYFNADGKKVLAVHQYLRPDGKIGASGLPDPKELYIDGVLYIPENKS